MQSAAPLLKTKEVFSHPSDAQHGRRAARLGLHLPWTIRRSQPGFFSLLNCRTFFKFIVSPIQAVDKVGPALILVRRASWDVPQLPQRTTSQTETCTSLPLAALPPRTQQGKASPQSIPAPCQPGPCPGRGRELGSVGLGAQLPLQPLCCRFGAVSSSKIALYESSARAWARGTQFTKLINLFVFINN